MGIGDIAVVEDFLHHRNLLDDVARGMWLNRRTQHIQLVHRGVVAVGVILRHLHRLKVFEAGFLRDFVLAFVGVVFQVTHIGDVAHIADFISEMLQIPENQVKGDGRPGVTQVSVAIDGGTADVHAHMRGVQRLERLLAAREAVVDI